MKQELKKLLNAIDENQKEINSQGKLDKETLKKVNYKFRLDWNYHSNKMEGGTLTLEETKNVMASLIKSNGAKPKKDFIEMDGHDKQVVDILKMAKGEQRIAPKRIRALHEGIMYEDNPEKAAKIGDWKKEDNYLYNYKGERTDFLPYSEVPDAIQDLCNWINAEFEAFQRNKSKEHPLILAAEFHLRYIKIHPFYDGNGRTARLLVNIILIALGFPPVIIKDSQKDEYGKSLAEVQEYGAPSTLFYEFMAERLIDSQLLMLKAIAGENIEEDDDLEKRLDLLDQQFMVKEESSEYGKTISLNDEVFDRLLNDWFGQLMIEIGKSIEPFYKYFKNPDHSITSKGAVNYIFEKDFSSITDQLIGKYKALSVQQLDVITIDLNLFRQGKLKKFNEKGNTFTPIIELKLSFKFEDTKTNCLLILNSMHYDAWRTIIQDLRYYQKVTDQKVEEICRVVKEDLIKSLEEIISKAK